MSAMESLRYTNEVGTIIFDDDLILERITGLGSPHSTIQVEKSPFQDGTSIVNRNLDERRIRIEATILGTSESDNYLRKRKVGNILNPKYQGTLTYTNVNRSYNIKCEIEQVTYPTGRDNKHRQYQKVLINLRALNPFFTDISDTSLTLTDVVPQFEFPLEIVPPGFEFGTLEQGEADIINDSDVEVPILIRIPGEVINAKIENVTTGEFIQVNSTIPSGSTLEINTEFGNKFVDLITGTTRTSQFNLIELNSTFFTLQRGTNRLKFTATQGATTSSVTIRYNNRYLTI